MQLIWIVAFGSTVCINVTLGLIVSVAFALFVTVVRSQRAKTVELVGTVNPNVFVEKHRFNDESSDDNTMVIVQFRGALQFVNVEQFRDSLMAMAGCCEDEEVDGDAVAPLELTKEAQTMVPKNEMRVRCMIIDCTTLIDTDYSGVTLLHSVRDELADQHVQLLLACLQRMIGFIT